MNCPCYTAANVSSVATIHTIGKNCEKRCLQPFIDYTLAGHLSAVLKHQDPVLTTVFNNLIDNFYKTIEPLKGSINNTKKTALSMIYAGVIYAIAQNPSQQSGIKDLGNQAVSWILKQKAYDGACADTLLSIANSIGSDGSERGLIFNIARNPIPVVSDLLISTTNKGITRIISSHTGCCNIDCLVLVWNPPSP